MKKSWFSRKLTHLQTLLWDTHTQKIGSPVELAEFLRHGVTSGSGVTLNSETAMQQSTVHGCVKILAESLSSLPLIIYRRRPDGGKDRATDHPLYNVLKNKPNSWQTSMDWRKMLMTHLTLEGNGYCWMNKVRGQVKELVPLMPGNVEPVQTRSGQMLYKVWFSDDKVGPRARRSGNPKIFTQKEILHIRNLSSNGIVGRSTLSDARESMGLAVSEQRYAAKTWGSGATPSGVLEHPEQLGAETRAELKKSFDDTYGGQDNTGGTLVLEEGMKWSAISISPQDAQFLESRRFSIADIARFFRVPLHMLQELERSTNNNIEQQSLEFVIYTLTPWLVNWEQVFTRDLFGGDDTEFFAEFLIDALLRGDMEARASANEKARLGGWKNADEIRIEDNRNPIPDGKGKRFLEPLNMRAVNDPLPSTEKQNGIRESSDDE